MGFAPSCRCVKVTGVQLRLFPSSQNRGPLISLGFQARLWISEFSLPVLIPQLQVELKVLGKDLNIKF